MTYNNLFTVPDRNDDSARSRPAAVPQGPAIRVGAGRTQPVETPNRPTGGLANEYEFSTGRAMSPRLTDDIPFISDSRGSRVKLAVMLALVAVLVVAALGTALVFAANR